MDGLKRLAGKARKFLALNGIQVPLNVFMTLQKMNMTPVVLDVPAGDNIVVLAPHMDDEVLGCGGTVRKHVLRGATVTIVFVTNGARGYDKRIAQGPKRVLMAETQAIREREARCAAKVLGVDNVEFLGLPDGKLTVTRDAVARLASVMEKARPDLIYLPFLTDPHHDHGMTNKLLASVAKRLGKQASHWMCCGYEVWNPIYPNCVVDISEVIEVKRLALAEHASQLAIHDYTNSILSLNAYRALTLYGKGYAEAFFLTPAKRYFEMCELMWP